MRCGRMWRKAKVDTVRGMLFVSWGRYWDWMTNEKLRSMVLALRFLCLISFRCFFL